MLRVGEENARLNCRGDENSRAKWSKVEATWRAVVLGCRDRDGEFLKIYPGERFVHASSLDPPPMRLDPRLFANEEDSPRRTIRGRFRIGAIIERGFPRLKASQR